jgi:carbonic anhydrase
MHRPRKIALCLFAAVALILTISARPALAQAHDDHPPHWSYSGPDGPDHWGDLDPAWKVCKDGKRQSPINIEGAKKSNLPAIQFDYKPSPLKIINNGHTIQVNFDPGSSIKVGGKEYSLVQFHFHHPSEEKIRGHQYDMVIHLVHKDSAGNLAVVALLVKKGKENPTIQTLWNNLPAEVGKEHTVPGVSINAADLLPADHNYYSFEGSLTIPACNEGVAWLVFVAPVEFSADQIATFAKIYPMIARPIQPANGREIKESSFKKATPSNAPSPY